jgi:hypothetical protein
MGTHTALPDVAASSHPLNQKSTHSIFTLNI